MNAEAKKQALTTRSFLSGRLAHVDIGKIERELQAAWSSAEGSDTEGKQVTRACALNLILFSNDVDAETAASNLLDEIAINHPCRAILAVAAKNANDTPSRVDAWVSARCHVTDSKSRRQICCEQITVRGEDNHINEIASVVLPLIVPDVPVCLWWRNYLNPKKLAVFLPVLDHLIVDSAKGGADQSFFRDLDSLHKILASGKLSKQVTLGDLNWRRSLPWRSATALSFDEHQGALPSSSLYSIEQIDITFKTTNGGDTQKSTLNQALLFGSWIATRLKWKIVTVNFAHANKIHLKFSDKNQHETSINLLGISDQNLSDGDIGSITLKVTAPNPKTINVQRPNHIAETALIFDELDVLGSDYIYEEVTQFIFSQILPLLEKQ